MNTGLLPDNFNTFFSTIAENLSAGNPVVGDYRTYLHSTNSGVHFEGDFCFVEVSFNQVRNIIDSLKNKKSRDVFGFTTKILKALKNVVLIPLTKLINICIGANVYPRSLKRAMVIPVFKCGDPNHLGNRPISLLPIISKVFEKCMAFQLLSFFEENHLLSCSQFGFRQGRGTDMAILDLTSRIAETFHNREYRAVLLCDLSRALDCVDHAILLKKLKSYNFDNNSIRLLGSYLADRC